MSEKNLCSGASKLVFACSGAADVGELSDRAARKITRDGRGKMFCMAGIGGRVEGILNTTKSAQTLLAIDGCALDCTKKSLENAGFSDFKHLSLGSIGFVKGQSPASEENVAAVVRAGCEMLEE